MHMKVKHIFRTALQTLLLLSVGIAANAQCLTDYQWSFSPEPSEDGFNSDEQVTICLEISSDDWQGGARYLHGIVPEFGNGWDLSSIQTYTPNSCSGDGGQWIWIDGTVTSIASGDTYGPGYFYESPLGGTDPLDPGDNFGDHCPLNESMVFCWTINTLSLEDCPPDASLDISVNTLSDDESGGSLLSAICDMDPEAIWSGALQCCDVDAGQDTTIAICSSSAPISLDDLVLGDGGGQWYFNSIDSDPLGVSMTFDPAIDPDGTYIYQIVSGVYDCEDIATVLISVDQPYSAGESTSTIACQGGGIIELFQQIDGEPDAGGSWLDPNGMPWAGPWLNPFSDLSGEYTYSVPNNGSCPADQSEIEVSILPSLEAGDDTQISLCNCASPVLLLDLLDGAPMEGGQWTDPDGLPQGEVLDLASAQSGTYIYTMSGANCTASANLLIDIQELASAGTGSDTTLCPEVGISLDLSTLLTDFESGGTWSDPMGQALPSESISLEDPLSGTYSYTQTCGDCSISSQVNIQVNDSPTASLSGGIVQCTQDPVTLELELEGIGPFDVILMDQEGNESVYTGLAGSTEVQWLPMVTDSVTIFSFIDQGLAQCSVNISDSLAIIQTGPPPSASLSGDFLLCPGQSALLEPQMVGNGPFNIQVESSATGTVSTFSDLLPGESIQLFPTVGTTFTILEIEDASTTPCIAEGVGQVDVAFAPSPIVSVSGGGTICQGEEAMIDVQIEGAWSSYDLVFDTGTDSLTISDVSGSGSIGIPVPFSTPDGIPYCLVEVSPAGTNSCTAQLSDTCMYFEVLQPLISFAVSVECDLQAQEGMVSFSIQGGLPPYLVNGISFTGNDYISSPLPNGEEFSFEIEDSFGCGPIFREGTVVCDCLPSGAGELIASSDTVTVCSSDTLFLTYDDTFEFLDADDSRSFILHDGGPDFLGEVAIHIDEISDGFYFVDPMVLQQTYWIHAIIANETADGLANENDICAELSNGVAVIFTPSPSAILQGLNAICAGEEAQLDIVLGGTAPWSFQLIQDGNVVEEYFDVQASPQFQTSATGEYQVLGLEDSVCLGIPSNIIEVTEQPLPTAVLGTGGSYCEDSGQGPSVSLTGDGPWILSLEINGSPSSITLTASEDIIPASVSGQYQIITVEDLNCIGQVNGTAEVEVIPAPSLDWSAEEGVCQGDTVQVNVSLSGQAPFDLSFDTGAEIIDIQTNASELQFESTLTSTWNLTALNDQLCSYNGLLLTLDIELQELPIAIMSLEPEMICLGEPSELSIDPTQGTGPFIASLHLDGETLLIPLEESGYSTELYPESSLDIALIDLVDESTGCALAEPVDVLLSVIQPPQIDLGTDSLSCTSDTLWFPFQKESDVIYSWNTGGIVEGAVSFGFVLEDAIEDSLISLTAVRSVCTVTDGIEMSIIPAPSANFRQNPEIISASNPIVNLYNTSAGDYDYLWTIDGNEVSTEAQLGYVFPLDLDETYEVCLTVNHREAGCFASRCKDLEVEGALDIYIPNAFSPNDDGINDVFQVVAQNTDPTYFRLLIFDRGGQIVFETDRVDGAWDGNDMKSGKPLRNGMYQYLLTARDRFQSRTQERRGHITLVR